MKNLVTRTLSGILFLVIVIGCILFNRFSFIALLSFIVCVGLLEFYKLLLPQGKHLWRKLWGVLLGLSVLATFFLTNSGLVNGPIVSSYCIPLLLLVVLFVSELYKAAEHPFAIISTLVLGVVYVALPFALMNTQVFDTSGRYSGDVILGYFILLWANDVGAYCFGMLFGRSGKHKLFARISPKKSWEGFLGGVLVTLIAAYCFALFWPVRQLAHWLVIAVLVSCSGTLGDLVESMLKRSVNVKDSGNIMPGHGGILDRFDGVLISFPVVFIYLQLANYINI